MTPPPPPPLPVGPACWTDVAVETVASALQAPTEAPCGTAAGGWEEGGEEEETISLKGWRVGPWSTSTLYWLWDVKPSGGSPQVLVLPEPLNDTE